MCSAGKSRSRDGRASQLPTMHTQRPHGSRERSARRGARGAELVQASALVRTLLDQTMVMTVNLDECIAWKCIHDACTAHGEPNAWAFDIAYKRL